MEIVCNPTAALYRMSVYSVLSAAKGAVGGGTLIPFIITTALDSSRAANDKYVQGTRVTLNRYCEIPTRIQI